MTIDVVPPKLVHVRVDNTWHDSLLRAWCKTDGRWRGFVTYSVDVGMQTIAWFYQGSLRRRTND